MKNKLTWFLVLFVFGVGVLLINNDFNFLTLSGSLDNALILSTSGFEEFPFGVAVFVELFCSIHMSIFVLIPLSKILFKDNSKSAFWIMFGIRAGLLFLINFIAPIIAIVDFIAVFVGAFLIVPIVAFINKKNLDLGSNQGVEEMGKELTDSEMKEVLKEEGFDDKDLLMSYLVRHYANINRAFYVGDLDKLKELCDDDVYIFYKEKYDSFKANNQKPIIDKVDFYDVKITSFRKTNKEAYVELLIKYKCLEYVVDEYNLLVSGSKTNYNFYNKKVEFYTKYYDDLFLECPNCKSRVYSTMDRCHNCDAELNFDNEWILISEEDIENE